MKNKNEVSMIKEAIKINKAIKIKESLRKAGINQSQLANSLGITRGMISNWISGRRNPKIDTLKKISKATGVPLNFFLDTSSGNISNVSGNNNIVGKNQVSNLEAFEVAQKYIKKLEEEIEILKKEKGSK